MHILFQNEGWVPCNSAPTLLLENVVLSHCDRPKLIQFKTVHLKSCATYCLANLFKEFKYTMDFSKYLYAKLNLNCEDAPSTSIKCAYVPQILKKLADLTQDFHWPNSYEINLPPKKEKSFINCIIKQITFKNTKNRNCLL